MQGAHHTVFSTGPLVSSYATGEKLKAFRLQFQAKLGLRQTDQNLHKDHHSL
jgi:hypothetical protein